MRCFSCLLAFHDTDAEREWMKIMGGWHFRSGATDTTLMIIQYKYRKKWKERGRGNLDGVLVWTPGMEHFVLFLLFLLLYAFYGWTDGWDGFAGR